MEPSVAAQAALHVAIGTIPGCCLRETVFKASMTPGTAPSAYCVVSGWSPSLHRIDMTWTAEIDVTEEDCLVTAFERHLVRQRRRSLCGIAESTARPFEWRNADLPGYAHLMTDATPLLMELEQAATDGSDRPRDLIEDNYSRPIVTIHERADDYGGDMTGTPDIRVSDSSGRPSIARRVKIGREDPSALPYRMMGPWIAVPQPLPESILGHCEGRLVRDIAITGPLHAMRRVRSVQVTGEYTEIRMEPCDVRLGDIAAMGMREALDHLRDLVTSEQAVPRSAT
jgi:hypothetical protein